ncbi:hypothetical protein AGMMS49983_16060 [Clostridia bacterium]|nr:hypothetical protein AGMMS49983_16060 [Clostridia bacterium]
MGGSIWVKSEISNGSTFGFTLRAKRADEDALAAQNAATSGRIIKDEFKGFTALLAEDIEINREIVESLLEPTGLAIEGAENGSLALEMFRKNPERYDIILMDVQMPVMDGYTATKRIRALGVSTQKGKDIPIIAMTANVFKEDIERSRAVGMNAHIGKPIDLNEMVHVLRQYLKK